MVPKPTPSAPRRRNADSSAASTSHSPTPGAMTGAASTNDSAVMSAASRSSSSSCGSLIRRSSSRITPGSERRRGPIPRRCRVARARSRTRARGLDAAVAGAEGEVDRPASLQQRGQPLVQLGERMGDVGAVYLPGRLRPAAHAGPPLAVRVAGPHEEPVLAVSCPGASTSTASGSV